MKIKKCAFCSEPAYQGMRLCKTHLKHQRVKMAEYRQSRKKLGLCSRCPNQARLLPDGTASTLCDPCRTHVRDLEAHHRKAHLKQAKKQGQALRTS